MTKTLISLLLALFFTSSASAQDRVALKTNLIYGAVAQTPNLGLEIGLGRRTTLNLSGGYNPWNLDGSARDNKKLVHWVVQPEFRYFLKERFSGSYFGFHALYSNYNVSRHSLPMFFGNGSADYRFQGSAVGAGLSYGYQLPIAKRWNLEFTLGLGYLRLNYDKYDCQKCGQKIGTYKKDYFGPTNAGISLIFLIN